VFQEEVEKLMGFILFRSQDCWSPSLQDHENLRSSVNERYKLFVSNEDKWE